MDAHKRRRSPSLASSSSSGSRSPSPLPSTKIVRSSSPSSAAVWTCSLPPSCDAVPSVHPTLASLEAHHRTYHAHVCVAPPPTLDFAIGRPHAERRDPAGNVICGRVFPDERFLQLHLVECHDEMAQIRRERGEKITPKGRRLHLTEKHGYPARYFFAVTIWGIEEVLKKGGGMVRRDWKPRPSPGTADAPEGQAVRPPRAISEESFGSQPSPPAVRQHIPLPETEPEEDPHPATSAPQPTEKGVVAPAEVDMDDLTSAFSSTSISLVPRSVRLARKTKMPVDQT
ncbi:hypothetical protein JCM8202v2_004394 [Rhodotorula sphaerocarpa]